MGIVKNTLKENYIFFMRELSRLNGEIRKLPPGNISAKKIGKSVYHYHQWREGKQVRSVSLGKTPHVDLLEEIKRRKALEKQRKNILAEMSVIGKAMDAFAITADEIIKVFASNRINLTLIGSYYLPVLKEHTRFNLPTIKTQDIDFLIDMPYRGKKVDIEALLKPLGFSLGFNPDGSMFFSNGLLKVEFLTPKKGRGTDKAILIEPLKIKVIPLRYLQMLLDHQMKVNIEGYSCRIPVPWVYAYHKILISGKRRSRGKKDKDILQVNAILREVFKDRNMTKKALSYLQNLPSKWKKTIKDHISDNFHDIPLN